MNSDYRNKLFHTYDKTHALRLDADFEAKRTWFGRYVKRHYLPHIHPFGSHASILEIGCGKGFLLETLAGLGFNNLFGIDLSPDDAKKAVERVPIANITCAGALEYLDNNPLKFDIIVLKAMLEHTEKAQILPLLVKIKEALSSQGKVIIDVPNMDWLFASHERYMDFTHEVGFTKESLLQLMNNVFLDVKVIPVDNIMTSSLFTQAKKVIGRLIMTKLLTWADPEGTANPIWARSIIGVGKK